MNQYAKLNVTQMKIVSFISLIVKAGVHYTNPVVQKELPSLKGRLSRKLKMSIHVTSFILYTFNQNNFQKNVKSN